MTLLNKKSIEINNEIVKLLYDSFSNETANFKNNEFKKQFLECCNTVINNCNSSDYIMLENKKFTLETNSCRKVEIDGNYIKFDIKLYNSYCFWFDDTVVNDEINDVQMMFHKFLGLFGKLIIKKQFLHKDGYLVFDCYNIKNMKNEIYTVSADKDKKFGYFYLNG